MERQKVEDIDLYGGVGEYTKFDACMDCGRDSP
jgi:hypothetical protein